MRNWSLAAKLFAITGVLLLLSLGLCGTGSLMGGTPAQQARNQAGMVCLGLTACFLFGAIVVAIFQLERGDSTRK
jgi:O-antigen ligase